MTERYNALTVVLDTDMRDDDAEPLIAAIALLRGVVAVSGKVATSADWIARERVRNELREKLWDALEPGTEPK